MSILDVFKIKKADPPTEAKAVAPEKESLIDDEQLEKDFADSMNEFGDIIDLGGEG